MIADHVLGEQSRRASPILWIAKMREAGILVALLLLMVAVTIGNHSFLTTSNIRNILLAIAIIATLAVGETMVIIARQVDISIAANMGVTVMVIAEILKHDRSLPLVLAALICIVIGTTLGAVNGLVIAVGGVPAIVATFGTLSIYHGIESIASGGGEVTAADLPASYLSLAESNAFAIKLPEGVVFSASWLVLFPVVLAILATYFLTSTRTGRQIYAVGSNALAARLAGIRVNAIIFLVFALCGTMAGLGGFLWGAFYGTVTSGAGSGVELTVIAAVVIGGTSMSGGTGTILGTVLGCLLLGVVQNALALLNLNEFWSQAITGMIILAAVVSDSLISQRLQLYLQGVRR
jgi:rhamnose transport system permease protein